MSNVFEMNERNDEKNCFPQENYNGADKFEWNNNIFKCEVEKSYTEHKSLDVTFNDIICSAFKDEDTCLFLSVLMESTQDDLAKCIDGKYELSLIHI